MEKVIRHVCDGHEYRYNTHTGIVKNNYGTIVSRLLICRFTGMALLYRTDANTEQGEHFPIYVLADLLAKMRDGHKATDETLAQFAIGHTATNIPEPR